MYDNSTPISGQTSNGRENFEDGDNLHIDAQEQELFIRIKDEVVDQIIEHGLSKTESKLFFYFLKRDRFGDRPIKIKVAEILLAIGISQACYHRAIVKFETIGWFSFKHSDVEVSNFCVPTKKSQKRESHSQKRESHSQKRESHSQKRESHSQKRESETLKLLPVKVSETSQTLQTYSDLLNTLSEGVRERFEKFCLKKIEESQFKIASRKAWLNKHGAEYLEEFQEKYPEALTNPEIISPQSQRYSSEDIPWLQKMYGSEWEAVASHYGLIPPNSPAVEIQEESEQVTPSKLATKSYAPCPQHLREQMGRLFTTTT